MTQEYVRLSASELDYGEKNLLHSQLELLSSIKNSASYQKLRKQEINLKIQLKRKVEDLKLSLAEFSKTLPEIKEEKKVQPQKPSAPPQTKPKEAQKPKPAKETEESYIEKLSRSNIEKQIEDIQNKLRSLH